MASRAALAAVGAAGELVRARSAQAGDLRHRGRPRPVDANSRWAGRRSPISSASADAAGRTCEKSRRLAAAPPDLVGYSSISISSAICCRQAPPRFYELGAEEARVRIALDLAAEGRHVALVCSGDAGSMPWRPWSTS